MYLRKQENSYSAELDPGNLKIQDFLELIQQNMNLRSSEQHTDMSYLPNLRSLRTDLITVLLHKHMKLEER